MLFVPNIPKKEGFKLPMRKKSDLRQRVLTMEEELGNAKDELGTTKTALSHVTRELSHQVITGTKVPVKSEEK